MDCRTALEILDFQGGGTSDLPGEDLAAAEAHVAECRRCGATVKNRRQLDRKVARVMRSVQIPRGARDRLVAQLAELETANLEPAELETANLDVPNLDAAELASALRSRPEVPLETPVQARVGRRSLFWRGLVPIAACVFVGAIGFFSVIWLMTPRWSTDDIRLQLARIDFDTLETLPNFKGGPAASRLPLDPGWQKLEWRLGRVAKAWPDASSKHEFAVYGFVLPSRQRNVIRGLLAVVPRRQMRAPPADQSLSSAASGDYLSARIGDSVSVAWTEGNVVYVCLLEGGEDSLATLRQMLSASAA